MAAAGYDVPTTLMLVTELLARAMEYAQGSVILVVHDNGGHLRVEVQDRLALGPDGKAASPDGRDDLPARYPRISALAQGWGRELSMSEPERATRTVWFECDPATQRSG